MEKENLINEIESWLKVIFAKENLKNALVDIEGSSEKGDGYIGDVVFVNFSGTTENESKKRYDLVLKCSKRSEILREKTPVKEAFFNEIYFYNIVLPIFEKFQSEKEILKPFDSVPRCFGTFQNDNTEIIALENLKKSGYYLWDRKRPLTRKHINLVVEQYGKVHAISAAMANQKPEEFHEMAKNLINCVKLFCENDDSLNALFGSAVEESHDLLIDDLSEDILLKWKNFKNLTNYVFKDLQQNFSGLKVLTHGDCWNNNFMFKNEGETPTRVAILDWQLTHLSSPIFDLSYFLFSCISKDDIEDMDTILKIYYNSFSNYVEKLGSNPKTIYPFDQFLDEWKKYSKYGIFLAGIVIRLCSLDKNDTPDVTKAAESGQDFFAGFIVDVQDKTFYKDRMKHIVQYAVKNGLTD